MSPIETAQRAFDAIEARQWERLVEMIDPQTLTEIRDGELSMLLAWAKHRPDLAAKSGGITGISSEGKVDPEALAQYASTTIPAFPGSPTIGELAAMNPRAFVIQWLAASFDGMMAGFMCIPRECLGVVMEGDTLAHVIYRPGVRDLLPEAWYVNVISLRRATDGRWLVLPGRELLAHGGVMHKLFRPPGSLGDDA